MCWNAEFHIKQNLLVCLLICSILFIGKYKFSFSNIKLNLKLIQLDLYDAVTAFGDDLSMLRKEIETLKSDNQKIKSELGSVISANVKFREKNDKLMKGFQSMLMSHLENGMTNFSNRYLVSTRKLLF